MTNSQNASWVCVHFALPEQIAGLREDLGGPSVTAVERDASAVRTDAELFDLVSEAFRFPDYFGRNWDALDECLSDMGWFPAAGYLLVLTGTAAFWRKAPATAGKLISAWQFAAEQSRQENTPFHLVFLP